MTIIAGLGQSNWQDYVFGTIMGLMAIAFVLSMILLGIQRVRQFFDSFRPRSSVDNAVDEIEMYMAKTARERGKKSG